MGIQAATKVRSASIEVRNIGLYTGIVYSIWIEGGNTGGHAGGQHLERELKYRCPYRCAASGQRVEIHSATKAASTWIKD